jgi:uncharacterized membrane protein (UPF0127 family)
MREHIQHRKPIASLRDRLSFRRVDDGTSDTLRTIGKLAVATSLAFWSSFAAAELPEVVLSIKSHKITAEVAATDANRTTGLMHRRMLPENRGMLFVFPEIAIHAMWMMNTYIPLSVAFIDADGTIINIADMQPHTQTAHPATRPAKYALEMNQAWFAKRAIKAGDKIEGLEKAGPGR